MTIKVNIILFQYVVWILKRERINQDFEMENGPEYLSLTLRMALNICLLQQTLALKANMFEVSRIKEQSIPSTA